MGAVRTRGTTEKSRPLTLTRQERLALLTRVPLFAGMAEQTLAPLSTCLRERFVSAGEVVCALGEPGDTMYFLESGEVKVSVPGSDGGQLVLATLGSASFFGEMALLDGEPRSANVTVASPARLLVLSRHDFFDFLGQQRQALENLLVTLSRRLREADRMVQKLAKEERPN